MLVLLAVGAILWPSRLGLTVRGVSSIVLVNESGEVLHSIGLETVTSNGTEVHSFDLMQPGDERRVVVRTSDLYVTHVRFRSGDVAHSHNVSGVANPGETFVIAVREDLTVDEHYRH